MRAAVLLLLPTKLSRTYRNSAWIPARTRAVLVIIVASGVWPASCFRVSCEPDSDKEDGMPNCPYAVTDRASSGAGGWVTGRSYFSGYGTCFIPVSEARTIASISR